MTEEQIIEVWGLFKEYIDKKQIDLCAEKYVDMLADYGIADEILISILGSSTSLDEAINYYLDADDDDEDDEYDEDY
jgi:hypothetical protein